MSENILPVFLNKIKRLNSEYLLIFYLWLIFQGIENLSKNVGGGGIQGGVSGTFGNMV